MSIEAIDRTLEQTDLEPARLFDAEGEVILKANEWHSIQAYVEHGLGLPITEADFRRELKIAKAETYKPFTKLRAAMIKAYTGVHENCFTWKTKTYPRVIELADDIVNYARTSKAVYQTLRKKSEEIGDSHIDHENKVHAAFLVLIEGLIQDAELRRDNAEGVLNEIKDFHARMKQNRTNLNAVKIEAAEDYAELQKHTEKISGAIKKLQDQLAKCWSVFKKDVIVIATSPSYAPVVIWFLPPIPVGLIAAAIVDTIHAIEMDRMRRKIDEVQKLLEAQTEKLQRDSVLMVRYSGAQQHVSAFIDELEKVLPLVQKMVGVWRSIAQDLRDVADTLREDKSKQDALWREVDLLAVEDAWNTLNKKADLWRQAAFIEVEKEPLSQAAE